MLFRSKNMFKIINKLEIKYESIDIYKFIYDFKHIFSLKQKEKNLDFEISISEYVPRYLVLDDIRLRQVLFNLLGNAFKFTEKGFIKLYVETILNIEDSSKVNILFEVSDSGIGIPEEQQHLIFEAFKQLDSQSTRRYGGTGLGLTITKRLVEMMDGYVEIESEVGVGSIFRVFINNVAISSYTEPDSDEEDLDNQLEKIVFNYPKILIAEDVESNREIITGYLEEHNVLMFFALNGKEAIELTKEINPDLIFMDIMMPIMDGYEAIKILKSDENTKDIPVIALTASVMRKDEWKIKELCNAYLRKPVSKNRLIHSMKKFLSYQVIELTNLTEDTVKSTEKQVLHSNDFNNLKKIFLPLWYEIEKNMINLHIQEFAEKLIDYSFKNDMLYVNNYAKILFEYADSFEIKKMEDLFIQFPRVLDSIKVLE